MINWKKVRKEYEESDITARALAEKYGIKPSTLRSRKNREGWKCDATQNKNVASRCIKNAKQHDERKLNVDIAAFIRSVFATLLSINYKTKHYERKTLHRLWCLFCKTNTDGMWLTCHPNGKQ
ncbi:hypothetical protein [Liquorilactobacillus satsumensis]|uniref:hypothetical protein n=1 Tax=Liquorilactobacillus satsumensis TaxID=259059 RepID=UPI0039E886BE